MGVFVVCVCVRECALIGRCCEWVAYAVPNESQFDIDEVRASEFPLELLGDDLV